MTNRDEFRTLVGHRLRAARLAVGYSLTDLSERTGIKTPSLSDYERGKSGIESFTLALLCRVLEADANDILGLPSRE